MALCSPRYLAYSAVYNFSVPPNPTKSLKWRPPPSPVHGGHICASSAEKKPTDSSQKKGRPSRARMSDEDLCNELRKVMLTEGLPADRVPLTNELSRHGRKDLANIVRRRGYKAVWEILRNFYLCDDHKDSISIEVQELGYPQEDFLRSKISLLNQMGNSKNVFDLKREVRPFKKEQLLNRDQGGNQAKSSGTNEYLVDEDNSKAEIDHLKSLQYHREMELAELKQLIEKEKQALTRLHARAQIEIGNAHRLRLSKEAELRAAEDKLSGLKEVQVQYRTNGETVEVAGSFNGWHKQIKLDLHPSSKAADVQDSTSRESKLWSTILWLYPGTYEIKFIVDGQWCIDPWREVAVNGHISNNVLRVDR